MTTEKQKATLYRMQRGGLKLARTEGKYIILSKKWAGSSTDTTKRRSLPQKSV